MTFSHDVYETCLLSRPVRVMSPGAPQTHQCDGFLFPSCICSSCHVENHGGVLNISLLSFCVLPKQSIQHPGVPFSMCLKKEEYSCWQYFSIYKALCSLFNSKNLECIIKK